MERRNHHLQPHAPENYICKSINPHCVMVHSYAASETLPIEVEDKGWPLNSLLGAVVKLRKTVLDKKVNYSDYKTEKDKIQDQRYWKNK